MRPRPLLAAAVALAAAGCGTWLPDSAFHRTTPTTPPASSSPSSAPSPGPDVGVTSSTIRIGNIASRTNFFDPRAFVGPYYGVKAFVAAANAAGGINGRRLELVTCDDQGSAGGNVACVRKLVDGDHVFALVSNGILSYGGASLVQAAGVPDIGSQPVDSAYVRFSHLWDVLSESYPRNGSIGFNGVLHSGTETYAYFKSRYPKVPLRAAVVGYNQSSSRNYAKALAAGLELQGYRVVRLEVNFALPDFDSAVIAMKRAGVSYLYDALDRGGNERLCRAVDDNRLTLTAKVTTTQNWDAGVRADYARSPACRNALFATGGSRNYEDTRYPAVAAFRAAMGRQGWDTTTAMSEWALEGWAGAQWFADAAASCGADLTRRCVEAFMARKTPYDAHGLLTPRTFTVGTAKPKPARNCLNLARWSDTAEAGAGGWVSQVPDMNTNCFTVPILSYHS